MRLWLAVDTVVRVLVLGPSYDTASACMSALSVHIPSGVGRAGAVVPWAPASYCLAPAQPWNGHMGTGCKLVHSLARASTIGASLWWGATAPSTSWCRWADCV